MISFGLLSIRQLAPDVAAPSLDGLAGALADLVDRGLASHTDDERGNPPTTGKQAFRHLVDETRHLYAERD